MADVQARAAAETEALRAALLKLVRGELLPGKSAPNLNELSRQIGRAEGYISHVLAGRMEFRVDHLMAVLAALDVSPAEFFAAVYGSPAAEPGSDEILEAVSAALRRLGYKPQGEGEPED